MTRDEDLEREMKIKIKIKIRITILFRLAAMAAEPARAPDPP